MTIETMNRKAKTVGLSIRKGYQRYLGQGGGFYTDGMGEKTIGYEVYDYTSGSYIPQSYTETYDHALTLDEATQLLRDECKERGLII